MLLKQNYSGTGEANIADVDGIVWCTLVEVSKGGCRITGDGVDITLTSSTQLGIVKTSKEAPLKIWYSGDVVIYADFDEVAP